VRSELHEHQKLAETQLRESLRSGHRRPIIQSPTGSGKTVLAAALVEGALKKGNRVAFTVPRLSLIDQTRDRFVEEGIPPSATPWAKGLARLYDDLLIPTTTAELIEKGLLSKFKVFAPSHPDLRGVETVLGDYHEGQLSEVMSKKELTADVVKTWLEKGEDRPTLAFCVDLAHARKLQEQFESAGVSCGYVDSYTSRVDRKHVAERFRNRLDQVVCSVGTLTTGIDWDVRCIILARPTKSEILYVQIIGRGLRTGVGKDHCLILDHSDTTLKLGFVTDIHHGELNDGTPNRSAKTGAPEEKKPRECPSCKALKNTHICPSCGFAPQRQSQLKVRDGELVELDFRKGKKDLGGRQSVYSGLLWYGQRRGYKPGWAAVQYKNAFGAWPDSLAKHPSPPSGELHQWIKSRQIAFAKGRANAENIRNS
jgi:DNA repair protein RadD